MSGTKGTSHPYKIPRRREIGNMKEIQDMQYEYIKKLKAALRDVLTDAMNYWDKDPCNQRIHSRKAKEVYAEEIKLCGLEVEDV